MKTYIYEAKDLKILCEENYDIIPMKGDFIRHKMKLYVVTNRIFRSGTNAVELTVEFKY